MTYIEFVASLESGMEYNFEYLGKEVWISQNKEGCYITEVNGLHQSFINIAELLEKGTIADQPIHLVWHYIEKQFGPL